MYNWRPAYDTTEPLKFLTAVQNSSVFRIWTMWSWEIKGIVKNSQIRNYQERLQLPLAKFTMDKFVYYYVSFLVVKLFKCFCSFTSLAFEYTSLRVHDESWFRKARLVHETIKVFLKYGKRSLDYHKQNSVGG